MVVQVSQINSLEKYKKRRTLVFKFSIEFDAKQIFYMPPVDCLQRVVQVDNVGPPWVLIKQLVPFCNK